MRRWLRRVLGTRPRPKKQYVTAALGLALTLLGSWAAAHPPGIYETQVYVVLLPPQNRGTNAFLSDESLVITAGVVAKALSRPDDPPLPTLDTIPRSSTGLRHGYSVRVPNTGSQWVYIFNSAELDVQVTGTSPEEVEQTLDIVLRRIRSELATRQLQQGASAQNMIRTELSPPRATIYYATGSRLRAAAITLVVGTLLTLLAVKASWRLVPLKRWVLRMYARARKARTPAPRHPRNADEPARVPAIVEDDRHPAGVAAGGPQAENRGNDAAPA